MMKSTTAQQIIDNDTVEMNNGDRMVDASTAYQAIEIAEKEAIERATRWISVEDELPEENVSELFKVRNADGKELIFLGVRYDEEWISDTGEAFDCRGGGTYVIGWRPIKYKE